MKNIIFLILLLTTQTARSEWIALASSNIDNIQVVEPTTLTGAAEGVYVVFKTPFTTTACTTRNAIAILDPKLGDRAYSALMVAMTTNKSISFYVDSPAKCTRGIPVATAFMLLP